VVRPVAVAAPGSCDCPGCSDAGFDPQSLIDDLVADAADLLAADDPIEAELFAAGLLSEGDLAGEGFTEALADAIVPAVARVVIPESLAVLLALDAVGSGPAAADAARRLLDSGVPAPAWTNELREPVTAGPCRRFADDEGYASVLLCTFERSGRSHGFVVNVDHGDCDAAADIALFPAEVLDQVIETIRVDGRRAGLAIAADVLDPAEFRRQVERALDARAMHDRETDGGHPAGDVDDEYGPGYHMLAVLLRARLRAFDG
jgi:hypothetical protein